MISILICSRNAAQLEQVCRNIGETIGSLPYEVISVNNEANVYSLFEAYNLAAGNANYDHLCFLHEDITIHTKDWGEYIIRVLSDQKTGVLGLAGAVYKTEIPSPWWFSPKLQRLYKSHVLQNNQQQGESQCENTGQNGLTRVLVTDGVWFCCRKEIWRLNKFDQSTFNGFHFYDLDFCMQAHARGYANYITDRIVVSHSSPGQLNKDWILSAIKFHRKWKHFLPASVTGISASERSAIWKESVEHWLINLNRFNRGAKGEWFHWWFRYFISHPHRRLTYSLLYQRLKRTNGKA